jgi:Transient receptor potential (TRP) ion channel
MTGIASLGSLGAAGAGSAGPNSGSAQAPNFADILQWFQFVTFSGMYSVNYPPVYRNFCKNFAWSTGLVNWGAMQATIDTFRAKTGGNLTDDNYEFVKNATLIFTQPSTIQKRQIDFGPGDGGSTNTTSNTTIGENHYVRGIEAFVEGLYIPSAK